MGMSMWAYKVNTDDTVERVSAKKFYRLYTDGDYSLFPDDGGRDVRFVLISVKLDNRRFNEITGVDFSKIEIAPDGSMDGDYKMEALRECAMEWPGDVEPAPPAEPDPPSKVVDAQQRFLDRRNLKRFSWKPTRKIMEEVRRLVERRAGVEVPWNMWPGWADWD